VACTIDIDTGGTFTGGFFVFGDRVASVKVPTTPHDLTVCFLKCIEAGASRFETSTEELLDKTEVIRFSNTIGTNTIIQRDGSRLGLIVKHWIEDPSVGVREGDSVCFNDPFYGVLHGADMGLCVPVFHGNKLVCFTGAVVHTGEAGGKEPGGLITTSESKYDEGLLVPPVKIGENFALREDILEMFAAMTRDPRTL
jgi:hypothetical protein